MTTRSSHSRSILWTMTMSDGVREDSVDRRVCGRRVISSNPFALQTKNLGVGSSNLSGRANYFNELRDEVPANRECLGTDLALKFRAHG
jgi:hypothetical protein